METNFLGPVSAANGGTGITSYAVGDLIYAHAATTLSKLADVATGSVLVSGGVGVAPAWSSSPTITGTLTAAKFTSSTFPQVSWSGSVITPSGNQDFYIGPPTSSGSTINLLPGSYSSPDGNYGVKIGNGSTGLRFTGLSAGSNFGCLKIDPSFSDFTNNGTFNGIHISFSDPGGTSYGINSNRKVNITESTEATTGGDGSLLTAGGIYAEKKIITATGFVSGNELVIITTSAGLFNGEGYDIGTITNAPFSGNPSKWIGINDNGTTRYIPAW